MNSRDGKQCYIFNDKALAGGIWTITIKVSSGKKWELRTSKTPFDTSANPYPTTGTPHGEKTATSDGITWTVNTTDEYFALCYKDSGAVYVDSVEMTYGSIQQEECSHTFGEWQTVTEATENAEGLEKRTCSKCNEEETRSIPKLPCSHTFGEWQTVTEATEDAEGLEKRTCSKCNEEETRSIPKLAAGDNFQKAVDAIADATTTEEKQAAIDNAMQEYDKLSPADQAKMHDSYLKLQEYIDDFSGGDSDGGKVKPYVWAILGIIGGAALVFAICYARSRRRKA